MSYLRPFSLQPKDLRQSALDAWLQHVFRLMRDSHVLSMRAPPRSPSFDDPYADFQMYEYGFVHDLTVLDSSSENFRQYLDSHLPRSIQEEAFHRGAQILRKEEFHNVDMFPNFLRVFWRQEFRLLNLPYLTKTKDRLSVLDHLVYLLSPSSSTTSNSTSTKPCRPFETESAKFRLFDGELPLSIEESYLMKRLLRGLSNLRLLVLWKVCDDAMLEIIGATCQHLEALDLWRSNSVTDKGLQYLLSVDNESQNDIDDVKNVKKSTSRLCRTLLRVVIKETSCTHRGCVLLIVHCSSLEMLDLSHGVVVREFLVAIRDLYARNRKSFSLKTLFLPVTNADILLDVVNAFPLLEDLRLWTSLSRISGIQATDFPHLHSLMLGGLHSDRILRDLVGVLGGQLTTLKVETVLSTFVPLSVIGRHCPNLSELQVINAKLSVDPDHVCESEKEVFSNLKLVYFFLVHYVIVNRRNVTIEASHGVTVTASRPPTALHCVLRHAKNLEGIQATGTPEFGDRCLDNILSVHPLKRLRRFILTDGSSTTDETSETATTGFSLTSHSVLRLFGSCPLLQCVGDLRYWSISFEDRREMFRQMQTHIGCRRMVNHCFEVSQTNPETSESPWIARRRNRERERIDANNS